MSDEVGDVGLALMVEASHIVIEHGVDEFISVMERVLAAVLLPNGQQGFDVEDSDVSETFSFQLKDDFVEGLAAHIELLEAEEDDVNVP